MRKTVVLSALALGLVGLILILLLVRAVVQRRASSEIARLLAGGEWGRITYSAMAVNMRLGITLQDAAFFPAGSTEAALTASEARISVSLWDLLRKRKSVAVQIGLTSPRLRMIYLGGGRCDLSSLLSELHAAQAAEPTIRRLGLSFGDGRVAVELAPPARQELAEQLREQARRGDSALKKLLDAVASRCDIEWSAQLRSNLKDAISSSLPDIPRQVELELSGSSSYEVAAGRFSGKFRLASPLKGDFWIKASQDGSFRMLATGLHLRPADPPLSFKPCKLALLGDADVGISRLALTREREAAPTLELEAEVTNLTLLPHMPHALMLSELSVEMSPQRSGASVIGTMGSGSFTGNWSSAKSGSLDVDANELPVSEMLVSAHGVAGQKLSLHLTARRPGAENPSLEGKLTLGDVGFRGVPVADELWIEGSWRRGYRFSSALYRGERRILNLSASGEKRNARFELDVNLHRGDLPAELPFKLPLGVPLDELQTSLRGDFALDSRRVAMSVGRLAMKTGKSSLSARGGSARLTWQKPDAGGAALLHTTLRSLSAQDPQGQVTAPKLEVAASREAFSVKADAVSVRGQGPVFKREGWRDWVPSEGSFAVRASGEATAAGWKLSGNLGGILTGASGRLRTDVQLAGPWPNLHITATLAGFVRERPLVARLAGCYDGRTVVAESSSIDYGTGHIELSGTMEPRSRELLLSYRAEGFELGQLAPGKGLSGEMSSSGRVSGTTSQPILTGTLQIPWAEISCGAMRLPISRATSSFTLAKRRLAFHGASLQLMGQVIFLEGAISGRDVSVSLWKDEYSPAGLLAALVPDAFSDWNGTGKLSAALFGRFGDLHYRGSFLQTGGSLAQVSLSEVGIRLRGDMHGLSLKEAVLKTQNASLCLAGSLEFKEGYPADWRLQMTDFPVELPAGLLHWGKRLALHGQVRGELTGRGDFREPRLAGSFEVADASLLDTAFSRIVLAFSSTRDGIRIDEFTAESEESFVTASGFWGYRPEDTVISLEVPLLDMSLFAPLMPPEWGSLKGEMGITLMVTEDARGEPKLEGTFQSAGAEGLLLGMAHFDRAQGRLTYRQGVIELHEATLMADQSSLTASGELPLPGSSRPLNVRIASNNFALAALRPLLPVGGLEFGGSVSSELVISGTWGNPLLSGLAEVQAEDISFEDRFRASRLLASVEVQSNQVRSVKGQLFFRPPGSERGAGTAPSFVDFEGTGQYNVSRADFDRLKIMLDLTNLSHAKFGGFFEGGLDGELSLIRQTPAQPYHLSGRLLVRKGARFRVSRFAAPPAYLLEHHVQLGLDVVLERSSELRYPPMALEGAVFGELKVTGELNEPELDGELTASSGTLMIYRHVVRLVEPAVMTFSPAYGLVPFVRGKAALELPGVLTSVAFSPEAGGGVYLPSYVAGPGESLTVYVHLNNLLDEDSLNSIELSSDPPLPKEAILSYLIGGPQGQITSTGFESFVQTEALLYSSSRLSRFLEESLRFERLQIWTQTTHEGNPLYLSVEKQLTPSFSLRYLQTFFTTLDERQEFAAKYLLYKKFDYKGYLEFMQRNRGEFQDEFAANLVVNIKF